MAKVTQANKDGTYDIEYEDNVKRQRVPAGEVKRAESKKNKKRESQETKNKNKNQK